MTLDLSNPVAAPTMTWEEFVEHWPEDVRAEWVDGEVILMSPASIRHQLIADFLTALVRHFVEAGQLGIVLSNPILMKTSARGGKGTSGREPDMIFVATQNSGRLKKNYLDGPADLVLEVISPESEERDAIDKLREYEQGGVREYWLLDPIGEQARWFQLNESGTYREALADANGIYRSVVLEGLWLPEKWLWRQPLPKLMDVLKEWKLI